MWYDALQGGNLGTVSFKDGRLTGFNKPQDRHIYYFGPHSESVTSQIKLSQPVEKLPQNCPSTGNPTCKANWDQIRQGASKSMIEDLLGSPERIENIKVKKGAVQVDETWTYKPSGALRFFNGIVVGYDKPDSYQFYGPVAATIQQTQTL